MNTEHNEKSLCAYFKMRQQDAINLPGHAFANRKSFFTPRFQQEQEKDVG
jgi:hypothetical protein